MAPNLRRAQGEGKAKAAQKNLDTTKKKAEKSIAKGKPKANEIRNMRELRRGNRTK